MREDVYVSRFLPSDDFRRIPHRPRRELRTLLVVASPGDVEGGGRSSRRLQRSSKVDVIEIGNKAWDYSKLLTTADVERLSESVREPTPRIDRQIHLTADR